MRLFSTPAGFQSRARKFAILFSLFSTTCTLPPQPYDKKRCNRFACCVMAPASRLIFASLRLLSPAYDPAGAQFGMCKLWQNGGHKRTSRVSRRRGQDVIVPCATASDAFSFPTKIGAGRTACQNCFLSAHDIGKMIGKMPSALGA
jgi:hypothetical protein